MFSLQVVKLFFQCGRNTEINIYTRSSSADFSF